MVGCPSDILFHFPYFYHCRQSNKDLPFLLCKLQFAICTFIYQIKTWLSVWRSERASEERMSTSYRAAAVTSMTIWWNCSSWSTRARLRHRHASPRWYRCSPTPDRTRKTRWERGSWTGLSPSVVIKTTIYQNTCRI